MTLKLLCMRWMISAGWRPFWSKLHPGTQATGLGHQQAAWGKCSRTGIAYCRQLSASTLGPSGWRMLADSFRNLYADIVPWDADQWAEAVRTMTWPSCSWGRQDLQDLTCRLNWRSNHHRLTRMWQMAESLSSVHQPLISFCNLYISQTPWDDPSLVGSSLVGCLMRPLCEDLGVFFWFPYIIFAQWSSSLHNFFSHRIVLLNIGF